MTEHLRNIPVEIIDESHPDNILSDSSRNLDLHRTPTGFYGVKHRPYSFEGFQRDWEQQSKLGLYLSRKFDIRSRGALLDVGFGENTSLAGAFADADIPTFAIDVRQHPEWVRHSNFGDMGFDIKRFWVAPKQVGEPGRINIFCGDVSLLGADDSELKYHRFGLILFNGSWDSGGFNFTIDKRLKERTLQACRDRLAESGLIGIVSSRYAYHGAGYMFGQLPEEKLKFLDLYRRLDILGAQRFYILGISQDGFELIARRAHQEVTGHQTQTVHELLSWEQIERVITKLRTNPGIAGLETVARIDGIFAEF